VAPVLGAVLLMACGPVPVTPSASNARQSPSVPVPTPSSAIASPSATAQAIDVTWRLGSFPDARNARISAIAAGGPGFVAVGETLGDGESTPISAAVWTSPDGASWSRVTDSGLEGDFMNSVAVLPDGSFIASTGTGANCPAPPEPSRAIWQSRDGLHWTQGALPSDLGCPVAFASNPGISVGVGYAVESPYAQAVTGGMWWSDDNGQNWQRAAAPELKGPFFVAAVPFGFVAIDGSPGLTPYSRDGKTWLLPTTPPEFATETREVHTSFHEAVAGGSSGLVLYDTFTSKSTTTSVWSSAAGDIWTEVQPSLARGSAISGSTSGPVGTVGVGWIHTAKGNQPSAWTTTDGITWLPTGDVSSSSGALPRVVAMSSNQVAALSAGTSGQGVTAWVGTIVAKTP
jgi:hypothetical protein